MEKRDAERSTRLLQIAFIMTVGELLFSYNLNGFSEEGSWLKCRRGVLWHFVILPSYLYICSLATGNMMRG